VTPLFFEKGGGVPIWEIRLAKHNQGKVKSTRPFRPWKIVYYEAYQSEEDAVDREKALKYFGR